MRGCHDEAVAGGETVYGGVTRRNKDPASVIRDMTSPQKVLLALARNPRGIPFVSLGRLSRPLSDLQSGLRLSQLAFLEIHGADRSVRSLAPQDLPRWHERLAAEPRSPFVIGFTAEQHGALTSLNRQPNLFAALEADEQMSPTPDYPPRFLHPTALRSRLQRLKTERLNPDDCAHRDREIAAALESVTDPELAGRIQRFRAAAEKYREPSPAGVPEGKFWSTDAHFLGEEDTSMPREVLPCPVVVAAEDLGAPEEEIGAAPPSGREQPSDTPASSLARPPMAAVDGGQFSLSF